MHDSHALVNVLKTTDALYLNCHRLHPSITLLVIFPLVLHVLHLPLTRCLPQTTKQDPKIANSLDPLDTHAVSQILLLQFLSYPIHTNLTSPNRVVNWSPSSKVIKTILSNYLIPPGRIDQPPCIYSSLPYRHCQITWPPLMQNVAKKHKPRANLDQDTWLDQGWTYLTHGR